MKLYENIRDLRIKNGWSQDELAKRAGYSDRSMITRIEKGTVDLNHSKILMFADIFHVDPVQLMGLSDNKDMLLSPDEEHILTTYRTLDPPDQKEVVRFVDFKASDPKYTEKGKEKRA